MARYLLATLATALCCAAMPARAVTVVDATGDFLASYTGPRDADLDVTGFSVTYNDATAIFTLGATVAGVIDPSRAGLYVIGVNTGAAINAPFASIGQPNVIFNRAIVIQKNGTGAVNGVALAPADITVVGNILTARVGLALLPGTGFTPTQYGFNLWPRSGTGNNAQISDFAPENGLLAISPVPEPASWTLMFAGFAAAGMALRRRRAPMRAIA